MSAHHDCGSPGRCRARRGAMLWGGRGLGALAVAAQILLVLSAQARSLNDLSGALGGAKGGTEALGGMRSLDQASPSNVAGMLQYCVKNNYLGGSDKATGSSLVGKFTGSGQGTKDSGFQAGSKGFLDTGGGETFGLGGSGLEAKITDQVCDMILKDAQSLL
jgi:Protein of unknown function (DUF2501)